MGERADRRDPRQLSLDDYYVIPQAPEPGAGSLNFDYELRATISRALKECPMGRPHVAARMSELTGDDISFHMLNAWSAESKENHRFPFGYAAAFCQATGTLYLLELLARKLGALILVGNEARDAELGLVRRRLKELQAKERELLRDARCGR
jgi:hypothetical protein